MADLTQSLLKAISIIADKTIEEVSSDKTIKGTIKQVVSTSEGKYLVNYNDGDFYAYVQTSSNTIYRTGEQVYILIPEGDMSQRKFIVGKVDENSERFSPRASNSSLLNDYVLIGDNAVIENEYTSQGQPAVQRMQPLSLNSQAISDFYYCYLRDPSMVADLPKNNGQYIYNTSGYPSITIDEEVFSNSAKQAEALLIRAKFKAALDTSNIGNYGIIVNIAFADETNPQIDDDGNVTYPPKLVAYILDTNKMTGNPMKFYDYTSQYFVADFDGEKYLYIDSIVAFSEGFTDQTIEEEDEDIDNHIYIDNLEIIALNEVSAISGDYKLRLTTPKGNTIKSGENENLKISATMTYLNENITSNTIFYWGVKDPSITFISDGYHAKIGAGYKYINNESSELTLNPGDLSAAENIYICTAVYESTIILKTIISLYNNNNKLSITIDSDQGTNFQFNEGNPTLTCMINGKTSDYQEGYSDAVFTFVWTKEDAENGSILLDTTEARLEAEKQKELDECARNQDRISEAGRDITQVLSYYSTRIAQIKDVYYPNGPHGSKLRCRLKNINASATYSCSVYRAGVYIGYGSITLQNSKKVINNNYYITITNGTQVFQYDETGIAPNSQKQQDPIEVLDLIAVFHSPQGAEVTPKKVRWIMPEGKTLINIPSLGLQTDTENNRKYFLGNIFPLTIKETYDNTCNDNQLTVIVTHADGTEYRQTTNLLFTKIGEIGTNGTETVIKINELIDIPKDECLTIIKPKSGNAFYNNGDFTDEPILEADLYTNNTQVLGYATNWKIAGSSKSISRNYQIRDNAGENDNTCAIKYGGSSNEIDTRIVEAEIKSNGKYLYSFYGIPAIEYASNYSYTNHPIKIMRDGTLKTVLYDSNGTNPTYDETQGVHIELPNWNETGYVNWKVESGPKRNGNYENPNFLLAASPKAKVGSQELSVNSQIDNIQSLILETQDIGEICKNSALPLVKTYIEDFLADIGRIGADTLLSTPKKLSALKDRLDAFNNESNIPEKDNIYLQEIYQNYSALFEKMEQEYYTCQNVNKEAIKIYNKVQSIWGSEWPSVITEERLSTTTLSGIKTIQQLINKYQQAYDNRSNGTAVNMPNRFDIKEGSTVVTPSVFKSGSRFLTLLGDSENYNKGLDKCYNDYAASLSGVQSHPILIEYGKVLMAYLNLLVEETQDCFNGSYSYIENNTSVNLYNTIKDKYSFIYSDWDTKTTQGCQTIGENIYKSVSSANGEIANIYDNIRTLYKYYQNLYLKVRQYQIAEESATLNAWTAILQGQNPNLLKQIYIIPNNTFNGLYMNNNVVGEIFIKNNNTNKTVATIYVPIIMTLNTYELASLNGWDGTSVEVGDNHIMTPQIGAGVKDDVTNTFTGMVMGVIGNVTNTTSTQNSFESKKKVDKVGLIGYANGRQSIFIDAETGKAYFGLPEDDTSTEEGINEGRIELIPGGVSKIGNWKIGKRFLYNIVDGSYEKRADEDTRSGKSKQKMMVPHDKYGIILSSDRPYIHVKGETFDNKNLSGIDYKDEYNSINPGDSLELRMDPSNKSLFSIVQHTIGFGDEDSKDLHFGYKTSSSDLMTTVVKDYVANKNISESVQADVGAEYYIYRLVQENGSYKPYYAQQQINNFVKINGSSWVSSQSNILNGNVLLSSALPINNFKKTAGSAPVFTINENTGVITYNPNNLVWNNSATGFSNGAGWHSITGNVHSANKFTVAFGYDRDVETPVSQDFVIGQLQNGSSYRIPIVKILGCTINRVITGFNLINSADNYIQFYIAPSSSSTISQALLASEKISLLSNHSNLSIGLFSVNRQRLSANTSYYLKAKVYIENYDINVNCSCSVSNKIISTYQGPPDATYGMVTITSRTSNSFRAVSDFSDTVVSGSYSIDSSNNLKVKISNQKDNTSPYTDIPNTSNLEYDFIVWKKGSILGAGRTRGASDWGRFLTTAAQTWDSLSNFKTLTTTPSSSNPWYISFYPKGYCTSEVVEQTVTSATSVNGEGAEGTLNTSIVISNGSASTSESISGDGDSSLGIITNNTITTIKYRLTKSSIVNMETKNTYGISWGDWDTSTNYNQEGKPWNLTLSALSFGNLNPLIPQDDTKLCIENSSGVTLQGVAYSKTYWEEINGLAVQKITLFKEYYDWVNVSSNKQNQYAYIDVVYENNIYNKYIKTLIKNTVNSWFTDTYLPTGFVGGNKIGTVRKTVTAPATTTIFMNALYWKEFIRIGIDENGRFFSAGLQDKKTYSRTGKISGFGKVDNLYGQEIRGQLSSNTYTPIIKIFSKTSAPGTTYITQGSDDNGNISIRTAGNNHYVELAASELSSNDTNSIPEKTSFVKVGYNSGIEIQANNSNKINLISKDSKNQLIITTGALSFVNNSISIDYNFTSSGYNWIKASNYILSSVTTSNSKSAISASLNEKDYRIYAFSNSSNNDSGIQLQVGKNKDGLNISKSSTILKSGTYYIDLQSNNSSSFVADNMKLILDNNNKKINLTNGSVCLNINTDSIVLNTNSNNNQVILTKGGEVQIKGDKGLTVSKQVTIGQGLSITKDNISIINGALYSRGDIYTGYNGDKATAQEGSLHLYYYKDDKDKTIYHTKVTGKMLEALLDWYTKERWLIGCNGNTVFMKNIKNDDDPSGKYDFSTQKYKWNKYSSFSYGGVTNYTG